VDPVQVREELDRLSITTFFGPIEFGETGQNTALDPPIFQIQGGQIVVLAPDDIATGELVYPFVPWNRR
jgi:branched-chain amino acid transport system substrate-binding protein